MSLSRWKAENTQSGYQVVEKQIIEHNLYFDYEPLTLEGVTFYEVESELKLEHT